MVLLSVVLPIHDVEEYLQETLDSLAAQTHREFEVVMVDDGSTDQSAEIAARRAGADRRFKLVRQENHGLGHARNTGARHATGGYLMFVDSDDLLPHYALRTTVKTLERTGSDFVTGKVSRIDARGAFPAPMHKDAFTHSLLRTNVTERPALMRDLLACNKVYRRAFWDNAGLSFVEGILYEDGPTSVKAHASAKSVDVIAVPIYYWRLRDGVTRSLSQQSGDRRFFVDRIYASQVCVEFLREHRADLLPAFYAMDIRHKFDVMFRALPFATPATQQLFMEAATPHLLGAPSEVVEQLPRRLREKVLLTQEGSLDELLDAIRPSPRRSRDTPRLLRPARALLRGSGALRTASAYLRKRASTSRVRGAVTSMSFEGEHLAIEGYSYVVGLPVEGAVTAANRLMWARHRETRKLVRLRIRSSRSELATASTLDSNWSYRNSGFRAKLDLRSLRDANGDWLYGTWVLAMGSVTPRGFHRAGIHAGPAIDRVDPRLYHVDDFARLVPYIEHGVMKLRVERNEAVLEEARYAGREFVLHGRVRGAVTGSGSVHLTRVPGVPELAVEARFSARDDGSSMFAATLPSALVVEAFAPVPVTPVAGVQDRLHLEIDLPRRKGAGPPTAQIVCAEDFHGSAAVSAGHDVLLHAETDGAAAMTVTPALPFAETATWESTGKLRLSGAGGRQGTTLRVVCRHTDRKEERAYPVDAATSGSWSVVIDPERANNGCGFSALRTGLWRLVLRLGHEAGKQVDTDLPYLPTVFERADSWRVEYGTHYRLERIGLDALALRVYPRLKPAERGAYNSRRLRESFYPAARANQPLRNVILYDSFLGKQFSDSPRAIYEALAARDDLELHHVWVNNDGQAPIPPGVAAVERSSRAWFEALATSRYVVANTHLPPWFRRRDGQVVAQTWHGIGFKRVGFDIELVQFANKAYLANLEREAPNWSFLLSPNSFSTLILRRAFRYEGEIAEIGSPRNDLLISGDRPAIVEQVRSTIGLPARKRIIMYAPTWRDNEYHSRGQYKFNLRLDVSKFPAALRDEFLLLVRRHPNTVDDLLGRGSDFVWDVANFPDTRDLLAAADVLITDYSTIALDFANTGRPIIFYTYDLASYRDDLRGFYFDLESQAPGPVVETTAEVVAALSDLPSMAERYRDRYEAFRQIFCHAEDGRATDRFVDRLLRDHPLGNQPRNV
jgi:CDP-glycerol glycerophosphotransferase